MAATHVSEGVTQMFTEGSIVIVDADSIYFRAACVTKRQSDIRKSINHTMNDIRRECMSDKLMVAVKGQGNFRHDVYPQYKANRKELDADLKKALNYGHNYMLEYHRAIPASGMEADDLVSIWAHECISAGQDYTIAGIDKDLLQIPGQHYNFAKKKHTVIDEDAGHYNLMIQCLTGDSTDNIPGIKGIGPKKAEKILKSIPTNRQYDRVRAAWRGHGAGDPTTSRRLLEMLKSWEEYEELRNQIESKATKCKSDVHEGQESKD